MMTCCDARELLDSFIAQELLVETNHELLRHLEGCENCRTDLNGRSRLRTALKGAFSRSRDLEPRPDFAREMAARLRADGAAAPRPHRGWWMAVAASLIVAAATGAYFITTRVPAAVRLAAGDHQNCAVKYALAERPIPLAEAAAQYDAAYAELQTVPPDTVTTPQGALRVADRHSCVFDGRRFGHVVYQIDGHVVSVLMTKPDTAGAGPVDRQLSWLGRVNGFAMAVTRTPAHAVYIVSDLEDARFRSVAQSLADPLARLSASGSWLPFPLDAHISVVDSVIRIASADALDGTARH
jgi:anti-sigma factor RsiW